MARAPFAAWRPIPSATDPKIVPIGVILHVDAGNAASLYEYFGGADGNGPDCGFVAKTENELQSHRRSKHGGN